MHINSVKVKLILLQITDSLFPIGGYTQSNGLETYVQKGIVKDARTAEDYLKNTLLYNTAYNEGLGIRFAWEYAEDRSMERIIALDEMISSVKAPREIRQGSNRLCTRFIKIVDRFASNEMIKEYNKLIKSGICSGHFCIAYGLFTNTVKIPLEDSLTAFFYTTASAVVNNCAKLIPLSQIDGQVILYNAGGIIMDSAQRTLGLTIDDLGMCTMGFEIRAMQHERLYSRLYMS